MLVRFNHWMCGRYAIQIPTSHIEQRFKARLTAEDTYEPHFNAAPLQLLPIILNIAPDEIIHAVWGFVPRWALEREEIKSQINARAETVEHRPMFRESFRHRRCLVLADSFYEWNRKGDKVPFRISLKSEEAFAMAGIWDQLHLGERTVTTFAIITTQANSLVSSIHDRMPVILPPDFEEVWLDPALTLIEAKEMLQPYPSEFMHMYEISKRVNSPRHDDPSVILPV